MTATLEYSSLHGLDRNLRKIHIGSVTQGAVSLIGGNNQMSFNNFTNNTSSSRGGALMYRLQCLDTSALLPPSKLSPICSFTYVAMPTE